MHQGKRQRPIGATVGRRFAAPRREDRACAGACGTPGPHHALNQAVDVLVRCVQTGGDGFPSPPVWG